LEASPELNWTPCYDQFTCTKLEVPLDYEDKAVGTTFVSYIKWTTNATNTANSTQDILFNPGGPGVSGVEYLRTSLALFQQQFGLENNFVSFDPRGVGASGPDVSCFPGEKGASRFYSYDQFETVDVNDPKTLRKAYARSGAFGDFCSRVHSAANDTTRYANTVATARDMLHYTELLAESKGQDPSLSELYYYGISYGTILGMTFAALFPDRVGRVIVDGVVDAEDYYAGKWRTNLVDADAAVRYFFETCHKAGKNGTCPFWAESPDAIEERYHAIMDDVEASPIPVSDGETPAIFTTADIKRLVMAVPYKPIANFPLFATVLAELETRSVATISKIFGIGARRDDCKASSAAPNENAQYYIGCNDANGRFNMSTYESWVEQVEYLHNQSYFLGEKWATDLGINCRQLKVNPPASQVFEGYPGAKSTKNPLLFVSSTIDLVTPLRSAKKMAARFGGAALLVQDSVGHASSSSPSKCTYGHLQQYIKDASLPEEGTICAADEFPFDTPPSSDDSINMLKKRNFF
jgi:pimeloyl-ACP methyl ester carboxylesterase